RNSLPYRQREQMSLRQNHKNFPSSPVSTVWRILWLANRRKCSRRVELFGSNRAIYPTPAKGFETVTPYRALVKLSRWPQLGFSLTFFLMGYIFCGYPGLQSDEVLAASPLFRISDAVFYITAGKRQIPIMVMTYVGALKTWLY